MLSKKEKKVRKSGGTLLPTSLELSYPISQKFLQILLLLLLLLMDMIMSAYSEPGTMQSTLHKLI